MSTDAETVRRTPTWSTLLGGTLLAGVLLGSYWGPLAELVGRWWNEPDYLYGFLVPVFSGWLLWHRRGMIRDFTPCGTWWGLAFLGLGAAMRWSSAYFYFALLDPMSIVPCLAGVVLFVGGWRALGWAAPSIVFLAFMIPLPGFVAGMLSHPLQRIGTIVSCYTLQTLGIRAVAQGNVIRLTEAQLGVVEACNGLRMMMLFFTVCFGAALVMKKCVLEKAIVVFSAAPIALLANVIRITATGILHETAGQRVADVVYHDGAGWFMMPMAVLILWGEMWLLSKLLLPRELQKPLPIASTFAKAAMGGASGKAARRRKRP